MLNLYGLKRGAMLISIMHNLSACRPVASVRGGQWLVHVLLRPLTKQRSVWASYEKQQLWPLHSLFGLDYKDHNLHAANYIRGNWIDEEPSKAGIGFLEKRGKEKMGSVLASLSFLASVTSNLSFSWWYCGQSSLESGPCSFLRAEHFFILKCMSVWSRTHYFFKY